MKTFEYTIKDELGIHARPAGLLVKAAKAYASEVSLTKGDKTVSCTKLMALMGLGVKCGDDIVVEVSGVDEENASTELEAFFKANL